MPYYQHLIQLITRAPHRVNAAGEIELTHATAELFRACGFPDAKPGWWRIPPIPAHAAPDWLFRVLPQLTLAVPSVPPPVTLAPVTPVPPPVEVTPANRLRWRLQDALRTSDQRRILEAMMRRPDAPVERRRFQRALHRLTPRAFNAALSSLIAAGLVTRVTRDGVRCLALLPEARELLVEARVGVRRPRSARAQRPRKQARTVKGTVSGPVTDPKAQCPARSVPSQSGTDDRQTLGTKPRRPYRPHRIPDRRRQPRQWGRSMRSRRGGLTVQKLYRRLGVHPTKPATEARLRKRSQEQRLAAMRESTAVVAPRAITTQRATPYGGVPVSPPSPASRLSAAWRRLAAARDARRAAKRRRR
jgi:hypothetical protein